MLTFTHRDDPHYQLELIALVSWDGWVFSRQNKTRSLAEVLTWAKTQAFAFDVVQATCPTNSTEAGRLLDTYTGLTQHDTLSFSDLQVHVCKIPPSLAAAHYPQAKQLAETLLQRWALNKESGEGTTTWIAQTAQEHIRQGLQQKKQSTQK